MAGKQSKIIRNAEKQKSIIHNKKNNQIKPTKGDTDVRISRKY